MTRLLICISIVFLWGCNPSGSSDEKSDKQTLRVAVAASCQFAFRELAEVFETQHENVKVEVITGSSGKLTTQILHGAPFDIFVSANMKYPNVLVEKNKTLGDVTLYGYGMPVFWTLDPEFSLENIDSLLVSDLVRKVAIAEPRNAPYGAMTVAYLKNSNIYNLVKDKLVYGESIAQVNEYILNKTVPIGVTAKSIILSEKLRGTGFYKELPEEYLIEQGMVIIDNDKSDLIKTQFAEFIGSHSGAKILKDFGYKNL